MAEFVWSGRKGCRDHRQAIRGAPFGRLGIDRSERLNLAWFGDRTERADLLFVFVEVQVGIGDGVPYAQQQRGEQSPMPQRVTLFGCDARHGFGVAEAKDVTMELKRQYLKRYTVTSNSGAGNRVGGFNRSLRFSLF